MNRPFPLLLILLAVGLAACSRRETLVQAGIRTQTLHINNQAEPRDFDPHTTTAPADINIIRSLLEGLTELDPVDCHPVPGVAERWEPSADGLTWTFHLRADAKWSNGEPVTAGDFLFAYQRVLSPAIGAEYREQFYCLRNAEAFAGGKITDFTQVGVSAPDARTLILTLTHPVPYLPSLLTQVWWFPLHRATIEKFGKFDQRGSPWTRPGNFVGNGAFLLAEWKPNQRTRVTKSPTYWDREHVRLNEAIFYPIENVSVGEAAFRAGQLHTAVAPLAKAAAYKSDPKLAPLLHESSLLETTFYRLNCERAPLNDARVRRALSLAIDREQLAHRVLQFDQPAFSFTPPNCAGYTAEHVVRTDVAEAKRLLAEAGFPGGRGFPALEMLYYVYYGTEQLVAEAVQQMWRANLGINIALGQQEMKMVLSARRTRNYQILSASWTGDYLDPTTFLDLMMTKGGNNHTGWSNAEYDALMKEAAATPDQMHRYELFRRAESLMLADAPLLPLYYTPFRALRHPAVHGWENNLLDLHPLKFVWLAEK